MEFIIGKKYRFVLHHENLVGQIRGKIFVPIEIGAGYINIHIYDVDGSLIIPPATFLGVDYWVGNAPNSSIWLEYLDFDFLKLEPSFIIPKLSFV